MSRQRRILVVDDSQAMTVMVKSMLAELGHRTVDCFTCPEKALNELRDDPSRYDIVLTDLNMPGMDGMALIRELGNMHYKGSICIISDLDSRIIELAAEVARQQQVCLLGSIAKPIQQEALQLIIDRKLQLEERKFTNYEKMSAEELLHHIERHQVAPYYQPKLNARTNLVDSLEVLARIEKPGQSSAILPGRFIPTAVEHDLMDLLTMQLAETTAKHIGTLSEIFGDKVKISLNLSAQQLADLEIADRLDSLFQFRDIDKSRVILEITEEYALKSSEQMESLNRLRIKGYGLSLDDFGTGFTNLHQLRSLPFTEVKIDRTLVSQIHSDKFSQVIVQSLSEITEKFDVGLVAEGVENFAELEYLSTRYPDILLQGFLISKPKPIDCLASWYKSWLKGVGIEDHKTYTQ
ncbi:EAL domain-containing protein [Enterovibrio paralichthyis]|uniref:EAL domain-containing response regulator n=1 Tax=Enterovibrio paralichthyis TaxID=2853805 RepID=UPI001C491605|nr:EAL domain-containing response regulator [Enterovibrio paralichthyis]MBV7297046.1 EAL domain-containing response regulator [Enterovibrio paralichthyis]